MRRVIDGLQYSFRVVIALVFQRVIFVYKCIDFLIVFLPVSMSVSNRLHLLP